MVTSWTAKRGFCISFWFCLNVIPFTSCFSNLCERKKGELYLVYFTKPITPSHLACRTITQHHVRGAARYSNTLLLFEKIVYDRPNTCRWILYPGSKKNVTELFISQKNINFIYCNTCGWKGHSLHSPYTTRSHCMQVFRRFSHRTWFHIISGHYVTFMNIFCLKRSLKSNYLVPVSKQLFVQCSLPSPFPSLAWISVPISRRRLNVPSACLWMPPDGGLDRQHA